MTAKRERETIEGILRDVYIKGRQVDNIHYSYYADRIKSLLIGKIQEKQFAHSVTYSDIYEECIKIIKGS